MFRAENVIDAVAIARKRVQNFPRNPCFGVAIVVKMAWWKPRRSAENQKLTRRLLKQLRLPGNFIVFVSVKNLKPLGKKVAAVLGATIYERPK